MMSASSLSQLIKSFTHHLSPFTDYKHAKTQISRIPVSEREEEDAMKGQKNSAIGEKKHFTEKMKKKKKASVAKDDKASSKLSDSSKQTLILDASKQPSPALFIFVGEFMKEYKENLPDNKSIVDVAFEKWESMSDSEKAVYVEKAGKKQAELWTAMLRYHLNDNQTVKQYFFNDNPMFNPTGAENSVESGKSSSEAHDDAEQEASS